MNKSHLFQAAHNLTKKIIQAGDSYSATFALCLKDIIAYRKTLSGKYTTALSLKNKGMEAMCQSFAKLGFLEKFTGKNGEYNRYYLTAQAKDKIYRENEFYTIWGKVFFDINASMFVTSEYEEDAKQILKLISQLTKK
ncbi:hypothetical protein [Faucicola boevrei]|uniref:hypothetical protein n=1 Tax=Faucicola boevrei TaxID=346665 RepID=UPI0003789F97|nr:hypothetical protein [Moraxella boevrei]